MSEQNKIVQAILDNAAAYAEKSEQKDNEVCATILNNAKTDADNYINNVKTSAEKEAQFIIENRKILTKLDVNKINLNAKRAVINSVYEKAVAKLGMLSGLDYIKLLNRILKENCASGEKLLIAENKNIKITDVEKLEIVKEKDITIEITNKIPQGFVLVGNGYEKMFTFDVIVDSVKSDTEMEIAGKLFNE